MKPEHKEELLQIRKSITRMGHVMLADRLPMDINEVMEFLKPFEKIEKMIDKIIDNGSNRI